MGTETIHVDLNRVEGDLEIKLEVTDNVITDAWCIGTMYRGFEQLLMGRASRDGLIVTPRICGICGTAHQYAAVTALETAYQVPVAPHGTRVRNICTLAEEAQSDLRHSFLMFTVDLCHSRYQDHELYPALVEAFEPFAGRVYRETIQQTKEILKVVALFGGQWPHSTFMVPGGVTCVPDRSRIVNAIAIVDSYRSFYERTILGCSIERWAQNESLADLEAWLDESPLHAASAMGLFIRFGRAIGLQRAGKGEGHLLSYGSCYDPEAWRPPYGERHTLRASGFHDARTGRITPVDYDLIGEHVRHSFYRDYDGARHPYDGETVPDYLPDSDKYSWAKAPRYGDEVVELGPLADQYCDGDRLVQSLFDEEGSNAWLRQFTRIHRPSLSLGLMRKSLLELLAADPSEPYVSNFEIPDDRVRGMGTVQAARGGLAHWVEFEQGKIKKYQVITPTSWNASPRDSEGRRGHWEQSVIGTEVQDMEDPIELGHIIRSHDACLVCTVHVLEPNRRFRFGL